MNPICFYHKADLDGVCSAAIVKRFVPDCELHGLDYGDGFPWDLVRPEQTISHGEFLHASSEEYIGRRRVYMVDYSLSVKYMRTLAERTELIWIDHHQVCVDMDELTR